MYLNQRLLARISLIFSQVSMQALLLDSSGQVILPESNNNSLNIPEEVLNDPLNPHVNGAFTLIGTDTDETMFLCLSGNSEEVASCARLCAQLITYEIKNDSPASSSENSLRMVINGEMDVSEIEATCSEQKIVIDSPRAVIYAQFTLAESENVVSIIKSAFNGDDRDYVCEVGRHAVAIIKYMGDDFESEMMQQYAEALQSSFLNELGCQALIGIGSVKNSLVNLHESLKEARESIALGRIYHPRKQIFSYSKMVLERFLSEIPEEKATDFYHTLFNKRTSKLFSDEMLTTIEKFFENSLNLSETARQLYIHRNTLVYRLDKIQKTIGLDLRAFEDAVTFKLLMLMGKQKNDKKTRNV